MTDGALGFKQLGAWQSANDLAFVVFELACRLSSQHDWLASDLSRTAIQVPANIAEGYAQDTLDDYLGSLEVARGALSRLEYYLLLMEHTEMLGAAELKHATQMRDDAHEVLQRLCRSIKLRIMGDEDDEGDGGFSPSDWPDDSDGLYEVEP